MNDRKARSLEAVLAEAKRQFSSRPYDAVSVNEIAAIAQCSTTTIYDVYVNKRGLYDAAAESQLFDLTAVMDDAAQGATALERLVTVLEGRIRLLSMRQSRETMRNLVAKMSPENISNAPKLRERLVGQYFALIDLVESVMAEGDIREMDPTIATDLILAQSDWRALYHGLVFGSDDPMNFDAPNLTFRILSPILSDRGASQFRSLRPGVTGEPLRPPKRPKS
jgi:AcrR family transcriptional regulator